MSWPDKRKILKLVRTLGKSHRYVVQGHGLDAMSSRNVAASDVRAALSNAIGVRESDEDNRSDWTIRGPDLDGDLIQVALDVNESPPGWMEIVTVYDDDKHKAWTELKDETEPSEEDEGNNGTSNR